LDGVVAGYKPHSTQEVLDMAWIYPDLRYYYDWYEQPSPGTTPQPTDGSVKTAVVEQLRANPLTKDEELRVDVKRGVVILQGTVPSRLAKRAAGDDCWDTVGVTDVSNQLEVDGIDESSDTPQPVSELMSSHVVALESASPLRMAAEVMRDEDVGSVVVTDGGRVAGIVTDRDLVTRAMAVGRDATATDLASIESERVVTMPPSDPVERATSLMREHAVRRIVVVNESDQPVGVVSMGDLARRRDPGSALADISAAPSNS
jgi:CBS domain-containing protein